MKRFTKVCLILAAIFAVCGLGIGAAGYAGGAVRDARSAAHMPSGKTETIDIPAKDLSQVQLLLTFEDVSVTPSPDGDLHITYPAMEDYFYDYDLTMDSLTRDSGEFCFYGYNGEKGKWWRRLSFNFSGLMRDEAQIAVQLPQGMTLLAETASGEIDLGNVMAGDTALSTTSGEIELLGGSCGDLTISSTSGEIDISGTSIAKDLTCSTTSGEIDLEHVTAAGKANFHTTSGAISLSDTGVAGPLKISSTSGEVELENAVAPDDISVGTVSGDVSLYLTGADPHRIDSLDTVSGDISTRGLDENGKSSIHVSTTSGDIDIGEGLRASGQEREDHD